MKAKTQNKVKIFWERIKVTLNRPDMELLPGQLAFFLVLAIIPTLTLITYGASVLNLSLDFLYDFLEKAFSPEIAHMMLSSSSSSGGLNLTIVLIVCYYLASNGTDSIILTSNTIYGIKSGSWIQRRVKAIFMSLLFVLLIVFLLIVPLFGDQIIGLIQSVNLNPEVTDIIVKVFDYLQSPFVWIFLFFLIKIIYIIAPDRKIESHNANYGAIFTTIAWIIITSAYSYYINNFANYTAFYGNLANICVLMIWFYLISYVFVIGMSLNYQKETDELAKSGIILEDD